MSDEHTPSQKRDSDMISMGGLWLKKSSSGKGFLVGNVGFNGKVLIFKNENKSSDNSPDYFMYFAPSDRQKTNDKPTVSDEPPF